MTNCNTKKNDEEKPSGLWSSAAGFAKSAVGTVATAFGLSGRSKDEGVTDMDVDSMGTVIEDGGEEELSEVVFQSLLESCPDDEVVVRSVEYL